MAVRCHGKAVAGWQAADDNFPPVTALRRGDQRDIFPQRKAVQDQPTELLATVDIMQPISQ
ncbi:hypothetical protein M2I81_20655 [Klebsiella pneumoniae]|nr:hypothetical protein [Klebsiella pneumoniae]